MRDQKGEPERDGRSCCGPSLLCRLRRGQNLQPPQMAACACKCSAPGQASHSLPLLKTGACSHTRVSNLVKVMLVLASSRVAFLHSLFLCTQYPWKSLKMREETAIWKCIGHHNISRWWRDPQKSVSWMSVTVYQNWLSSIKCFESYRTGKQNDNFIY